MKRFPILGAVLLIPAIVIFGTVGCTPTKKDDKKPAADSTKGKDGDKGKDGGPKKKEEIATAPEATVKGVVMFKGKPPAPEVNPVIATHDDAKKGFCGTAADQHKQEWIVSKDGGVANVIISLAPPADKKFKKLDDKHLEAYKKPVVVDQPFCNYIPHVVALYAEYQPFVGKNTAKMLHNVKIEAGEQLGGTKDLPVAPGKDTGEVWLKGGPEAVINTTCSIHTWMAAKIGLFNHPYFSVTNDKGEFEIKNVPIDSELTVYMWHESTGKKVEVQKLTAKKGDNTLKLEIGAK